MSQEKKKLSTEKPSRPLPRTRIQTAEGWKRHQERQRKSSKAVSNS